MLSTQTHQDYHCYDVVYESTNSFYIGAWLLLPKYGEVKRGIIVGHGYGGRDKPDFHLPIADAAFLFPCFRGLSKSRCDWISDNPYYHVQHDLDKRDDYIIGKCVEDLWLAVSVLIMLVPEVYGHIGYIGLSFGGGIGALALPCEYRIQRAHFNVPTFGHHALRMQFPTWGSTRGLQDYKKSDCHVLDTLSYYDAATAARHIKIPVHVAAALKDPVVAPPSQFSIYNALSHEKQLFILDMGHSDYPHQKAQEHALLCELQDFFKAL